MEKKNLQTFNLEVKNFKEVYDYCYLNQIIDVNSFVTKCFRQGFDIQKHGILGDTNEVKEVEKIVEVPVEKIVETVKEVEVIKYVDREVVKEVPVEKVVSKIEYIYDKSEPQIIEKEVIKEVIKEVPVEGSDEKTKMLQTTLLNLRKELQLKNTKINELEEKIKSLEGQISTNVKAIFMKSSNLNDTL